MAPTILRQAGGSTLPVCGYTVFEASLNNTVTSIRAVVVTKLHKNLLISWQDLISLKVINENFPTQIQVVHAAEQELYESSRLHIINKFQETLSDDLNPNPMEIPGKSMHIYLQPIAVPNSISIAITMCYLLYGTLTLLINCLFIHFFSLLKHLREYQGNSVTARLQKPLL